MTRGNIVNALYVTGLAVIVVAVAFTLYYYFGDPDQWESLRGGFDTLTALSSLLRDLVVLGIAIGVLLAGLGWHIDKDRAESRSSIVAALFVTGVIAVIVGVAWAVNQYFGEPEQYDAIEAQYDSLAAILSFLRDLVVLGIGIGVLVLGLAWHIARGQRT
jgi:cytochrome bd-type quinol oxidase subunit 2